LRKALEEARSAERMTTEHELRAVVAERIAHAVDRAAAAGDEARLLKASATLLELVDTLPVRSDVPGGGAAGDGGDDRRSAALRLLDSPPEVGDAADA
jgi:hypothetical protein